MANRPKPTALKLLMNNPGKRPINKEEPIPESGIPEMPEWLNQFPIAVKEWNYESDQLLKMGLLTRADPNELAWRCYIASQMQELVADIKTEGRTTIPIIGIRGDGEPVYGSARTNPKCIQLASLLIEYRQKGILFGLDPSSRARLKASPAQKKSKIEEFMKKKHEASKK